MLNSGTAAIVTWTSNVLLCRRIQNLPPHLMSPHTVPIHTDELSSRAQCSCIVFSSWWVWNLAEAMTIIQNYWGFRLCPLSGILETRKHNVLETGSVSVLRWGGEDTWKQIQFLKHCFLVSSRIPVNGQSPKTQYFWELHTIVRTLRI
jgi:hypothetical protein